MGNEGDILVDSLSVGGETGRVEVDAVTSSRGIDTREFDDLATGEVLGSRGEGGKVEEGAINNCSCCGCGARESRLR